MTEGQYFINDPFALGKLLEVDEKTWRELEESDPFARPPGWREPREDEPHHEVIVWWSSEPDATEDDLPLHLRRRLGRIWRPKRPPAWRRHLKKIKHGLSTRAGAARR